jgi:phosphoglycolate phosphatase
VSAPAGFTVGFDLDMTLIDSRPGIAATYRALVAETGVFIDVDAAVGRLGPPLDDELSRWYPPEQVPAAVARYRALYPHHAIAPTVLLPGAADAVAAVHRLGGRVVVVTAKRADLARLHLAHLGLTVAGVAGLAWRDGKARELRAAGAIGYVGDHVADMAAALAAGIPGIGVTTGPCSAADLRAAGASLVLPDLIGFPTWLAGMDWAGPPTDD